MFLKNPILKFIFGKDNRKSVPKEENVFDEVSITFALKSNMFLKEIIIVTKIMLNVRV